MGPEAIGEALRFLGITPGYAALGAVLIWILKGMADSVKELNLKMALICQQLQYHEQRLQRLEIQGE